MINIGNFAVQSANADQAQQKQKAEVQQNHLHDVQLSFHTRNHQQTKTQKQL